MIETSPDVIQHNIHNQEQINLQNQQKSSNPQNFNETERGQSQNEVGSSENLFLSSSAKFSDGIMTGI